MNDANGTEIVIPWMTGEANYRRLADTLQADASLGGALLGPGRWALSPRSTVPFVAVETVKWGVRQLSWGEVLEIPEGTHGRVRNASFHAGDAIFEAVGSCASAPNRPAAIAVPAGVFVDTANGVHRTRNLDVRMARRAYMVNPSGIAAAPPVGTVYTVQHFAPTRGEAFAPGTAAAAAGGALTDLVALFTFGQNLPLGIGSGENVDTLGRSLAELRPMAFRDYLYVEMVAVDAVAAAFDPTRNVFFVVEY